MPSPFTFCTWNILATAYIRPDYYPNTPPHVLERGWRLPALVRRARELQVDILCLQEVESDAFIAIEESLSPLGYSGRLAMKAGRKPDGCAIFFRDRHCRLLEERRLVYTDGLTGPPHSGHIAQFLTIDVGDVRLNLVNTHLKWDPPGTPRDRQWGYRQAGLALSALPKRNPETVQVICGDFNVQADSPVISRLTAAGFSRTHLPEPGVYSCNSGREPKLIDYILFRGPVRAQPVPLPAIESDSPLPSPDQPSDHLPLIANFSPAG